MSILEIEDTLFQIDKVWCDEEYLNIMLKNRLVLATPLQWYERLARADERQRANYRILPFGDGVHWPDIDEDLSVEGILRYAATKAGAGAFEAAG